MNSLINAIHFAPLKLNACTHSNRRSFQTMYKYICLEFCVWELASMCQCFGTVCNTIFVNICMHINVSVFNLVSHCFNGTSGRQFFSVLPLCVAYAQRAKDEEKAEKIATKQFNSQIFSQRMHSFCRLVEHSWIDGTSTLCDPFQESAGWEQNK